MRKIVFIAIVLFLSSCEKHNNPVSLDGETFEGSGGTISSSGKWQEFNTSNSYLPANTIRCLGVDCHNQIWIGMDEGLVCYNGTQWTVYNTENSGLPLNRIWSLACEDDTVWIGAGSNLVKFDGYNWRTYNSTNSPLIPGSEYGMIIITIKVDSKHNIWLGTNYYGLFKFDKMNWRQYYPNGESLISSPSIKAIDIDNQDRVWIGHAEPAGVDRFDGTTWTNYTPENSLLPGWYIVDVYVDHMNVKWFCTRFGLARFDDAEWTVYDTSNFDIQDEIIFSSSSDSKNDLWVGTFSGALLTMEDDLWVTYYIGEEPEPVTPYITINCVVIDGYDNKWVGTIDSGLYQFNENGIKH